MLRYKAALALLPHTVALLFAQLNLSCVVQKLWAKDKFLKAGGDGKTLRRKTEGFRQLFSTLHAIEAAKR